MMQLHVFTYRKIIPALSKEYIKVEPMEVNIGLEMEVAGNDDIRALERKFDDLCGRNSYLNTFISIERWIEEKDRLLATLARTFQMSMQHLHGVMDDRERNLNDRLRTHEAYQADWRRVAPSSKDYQDFLNDKWLGTFTQKIYPSLQAAMERERDELALQAFRKGTLHSTLAQNLKNMPEHKKFVTKKTRVWAGLSAKAVPILLVTGTTTAGLAVTTGGVAPAAVAASAIGVAWKNGPKLWGMVKDYMETLDIEERIFAKAKKDVNAVAAAFDEAKAQGSSLAKHMTELKDLMKFRDQKINHLQREIAEARRIATLPAANAHDRALAAKTIKIINEKLPFLVASNEKAEALIGELEQFSHKLPLALFEAESNTMAKNLANYVNPKKDPKLKNWGDWGSTDNSITGGVTAIADHVRTILDHLSNVHGS